MSKLFTLILLFTLSSTTFATISLADDDHHEDEHHTTTPSTSGGNTIGNVSLVGGSPSQTIYSNPYTNSSSNASASSGAYSTGVGYGSASSNSAGGSANSSSTTGASTSNSGGNTLGQGQSATNTSGNVSGGNVSVSDNSSSVFKQASAPAIAPSVAVSGNNGASFGVQTILGGFSGGVSKVDKSQKELNYSNADYSRAAAASTLVDSLIKLQQCPTDACKEAAEMILDKLGR